MSKTLPYQLSGNEDSTHLLVFLHGWPDTLALWNHIIVPLEKDHYILNVTYPNFNEKEKELNGIDFEEIVQRLKNTIDSVNDTKRKILLIGHDWGCTWSYFLDNQYPGYVSGMVPLDLGPAFKAYNPFIVFIFFYMIYLVIAFLIGGLIGKKMTVLLLKLFSYKPAWIDRIDSSWNYPYYYLMKRLIKSKGSIYKAYLADYKPSCPVAFVYGTKKPMQFYTQEWADLMKNDPRNEIHAVSSLHWIMNDTPEFLIDLIQKRAKMFEV